MAEMQRRKYSRRTVALFWCVATAVLIGGLIYAEQIALLYVLATLVIVALLLVVGRADLEKVSRDSAGFAASAGDDRI